MDFETEIIDLKRRMDELEGAVSVLTGHISNVHPELIHLKDLSTRNFGTLNDQMGRFVKRLDTMNTQVWSLRDDLPSLITDAVRKSLAGGGN